MNPRILTAGGLLMSLCAAASLFLFFQDKVTELPVARFLARNLQEDGVINEGEDILTPIPNAPESADVDTDNVTRLYDNVTSQFLFTTTRLQGHITTDKVIYRPNDVMFVEVLVLDAFTKKPVAMDRTDTFFGNFFVYFEVYDPTETKLYTSTVELETSTASFTYKVPTDAVGGEYTIRVFNYQMPSVSRVFRIRDYIRDQMTINAEFALESYYPGDRVNGILTAQSADGSVFQEPLTFSYSVDFGQGLVEERSENVMSAAGEATFTFVIPENTTQLQTSVVFVVEYQSIQQPYTKILVIGQPDELVIDFAPETSKYALGLPNKVYFIAYTNYERTHIVDFSRASLKAESTPYPQFPPQPPIPYVLEDTPGQGQGQDGEEQGEAGGQGQGQGQGQENGQGQGQGDGSGPGQGSSQGQGQDEQGQGQGQNETDGRPLPPGFEPQVETIIDSEIETIHKGKGLFTFTPKAEYIYYLEIDLGGRIGTIRRNLTMGYYYYYQPMTSEVTFTILNEDKALEYEEDLRVAFHTNELVSPRSLYGVFIKQKEKVLHNEIVYFERNQDYQMIIPASAFKVINGGVLSLTLVQLTQDIIYYSQQGYTYDAGTSSGGGVSSSPVKPIIEPAFMDEMPAPDEMPVTSSPDIMPPYPYPRWETGKGEILFFKKPSEILMLNITTNKETYAPGDEVEFEIQVINKTTGEVVEDSDAYVSVFITDETVFGKIDQKQLPPSLPAQVYLQSEVQTYNYQFHYANEYINHIYTNDTSDSADINLDLLLGIQTWRQGYFYLDNLAGMRESVANMTKEQVESLQSLYGYVFDPSTVQPPMDYGTGNGDILEEQLPVMNIGGDMAGPTVVQDEAVIDVIPAAGDVMPGPIPGRPAPSSPDLEIYLNSTAPNDFMNNIRKDTRIYAHQLRENYSKSERVDMTETVFYATMLRTSGGVVSGNFSLSDLITKFRITAHSINAQGALGYETTSFQTQKPFYIDFQLPASMVVGDVLDIPVYVYNNVNTTMPLPFAVANLSGSLESMMTEELNYAEPLSNLQKIITFTALGIDDNAFITILLNTTGEDGEQYIDQVTQTIQIVPQGFPESVSQGGFIGTQLHQSVVPSEVNFRVRLPSSMEEGSFKFTAKVFSSSYSQLMQAIEALIRDPYGCFEQAASTTYPQVMAMDFLMSQPEQTDEVLSMETQLESKLAKGYKLLTTYKVKETKVGDGFEWFGDDPAHEALTAYGLMQFNDMSKVTSVVDSPLISNVKEWLLSRRDTVNGGFLQNPQALDSFGRAPKNVTDAYIIWALSSSGEHNITEELEYIQEMAANATEEDNIDPYIFALIASTLYNENMTSLANEYARELAEFQQPEGNVTGALTSITSSMGMNLDVETTALAVIAWMNEQEEFTENIQKAIDWIVQRVRQGGAYGSTQATVLALKAITSYMKSVVNINGEGEFVLSANGEEITRQSFGPDSKEVIQFDISDYIMDEVNDTFAPGQDVMFTLSIEEFNPENETSQQDFKLSYSMLAEYHDELPQTYDTVIGFNVRQENEGSMELGAFENLNELFQYNVTISNLRSDWGIGMTVAIFRVPACLEIDFNMLEQMKTRRVFDMYEVRNSNTEIVMYWRALMPREIKTFNIGLLQRFSGQCYEKPHTAYMYYNNDQPIWSRAGL